MPDLADMFQDGPPEKGRFLSRVFGIFSEEIVRIWAQDPRSPYQVLDKRPTLYDAGKRYSLDFLFLQNGRAYVAEMKCEIRYQNYRFWRLTESGQLDHHKNKKAFELFCDCPKIPPQYQSRPETTSLSPAQSWSGALHRHKEWRP